MKVRILVLLSTAAVLVLFTLPALCQEVKEINVAKVSKTAPVIDGKFTEDEWAGSTWTDEFYGADLGGNNDEYRAARVDSVINIKWRALWDEDYLYFMITTDMKFQTPNGGLLYDQSGPFNPILADDGTVGDWGAGCDNFEIFLVTKWTEDLGNEGIAANSSSGPPNYHLIYFPVINGEDADGNPTPNNFGIRGASGPPFFTSGYSGANQPGSEVTDPAVPTVDWQPITGEAQAQTKGVKPYLLAAVANEVAGAKDGEVVAKPVCEMAIPFSQLSYPACNLTFTTTDPDTGETITETRIATKDDIPLAGGDNIFLEKDAQGHWVKVGDKWLINICCYTDGWFAANGLTYITWNQMQAGGFHNWPRGIMTFAAPVKVDSWMLY